MKAISLLQPWATLIMLGYKQFETRSWATKHRGPLAIAASAGKKGREACAPGTDLAVLLANHGLTFDDLPRGAILGVCQVESMHKMDKTWDLVLGEVELACGDYTNGRYAWALANVQAFATPIDCKGKLSLWEVPAEVEEQFPEQPVPGVMWAVVSCGASHPHRYVLPHAPRPPYARFDTKQAAEKFISECGGSPFLNTVHWERAYHAVSPPTCDTTYCQQCRDAELRSLGAVPNCGHCDGPECEGWCERAQR
jgi:hypothetical protein